MIIKKEEKEIIKNEEEKKRKELESEEKELQQRKDSEKEEEIIKKEEINQETRILKQSQIIGKEVDEEENMNNKFKKEKENKNYLNQNSINIELENNSFIIPENFKNSKLFKSLKEEQKKNAISILNEVQKFKENPKIIKDIDAYQTINIDLNQKEETLDNLIPDFSSKKNNEKKEELEKRKNSFINHIYFEGLIEANPLLELIPECKISHIDLLKQIYDEKGLKNIPTTIEDNYKEIIFTDKNPLIPEYYSPIGYLEDLKGFTYKYNFYDNSKIYLNCFKTFNYWRSIQGDGNSFYRTFMFSLIEYYILYKYIYELKQLISEISSDDLIKEYNEHNINYNLSFYILGTILHLLSKDEIKEAYDLFIKSYLLKDGAFDKILIIYLRYISFIYIDEVIKLCDNEEIQEQREERIVVQNINKEMIKTMNIEPNFFIICLMSYLFDININFFYIDRDFSQSREGNINFIDEDNMENIPLITFAYFYSSYFKIYSHNFIQENEEINDIFKLKLNKLSKLTLKVKNPKKCQICQKGEFVLFLEQKFKICQNCLENYICNKCSLRKEALIKDNFIGLEYYSRPFNLKDNFILNDYEFIEINENNIINYLQNEASTICSSCKKNFDKKNLNNLKCKCLLCDKCLEEIILKITKGLKILNSYEKKNLGNITCSICSGNFSFEDAIEHLKDIKEKDKDNAIKRMNEYVNTLCLVCGEKVRQFKENSINNNCSIKENNEENNSKNKTKEIFKEIKNYKKLKIRKENDKGKGIDYSDNEHVICINCYEKIKYNSYSKNDDSLDNSNIKGSQNKNNNIKNINMKNKYYADFDEGECFCYICNKRHFLIDKKTKDGGCFTSGCIMINLLLLLAHSF